MSSSRKRDWFDATVKFLGIILLVGIFVIQVVSISNDSSSMIAKRLESSNVFFDNLMKRYPAGQLDTTIHQAFSTIENVHKLSARAHTISERVPPEQWERAMRAVSNVDIKGLLDMVDNMNRLLTGVQSEHVNGVASNIQRITRELNVSQLNNLVESTRAIEERLKNLHEIKIQV
jgi:hypothetical protein